MPHKCCVPGCKSNYRGQEYVSVFTFPSDPDVKEKWLKLIGRRDINKNSVVCAKHFQPQFIVTVDCAKRDDGTLLSVPRSKPKLQNDAVPSIFPHASSSLSAELPRKRKAAKDKDIEDTGDTENFAIKDSVSSFRSLRKEIDSHIHQRMIKSNLAVTSRDKSPSRFAQGEAGEAAYVTQKLEFMEQQRKYMHMFTDHFIDKMVREGKSWTKTTVLNKPDFPEMCQTLEKAVEFLCLMCEGLSGAPAAEIKDGVLTRPELCHTSLALPGLASGKNRLLALAAANISRRRTLALGRTTGVYSCPHCCNGFSQQDVLCSHMDRAHSQSYKWDQSNKWDQSKQESFTDVVDGETSSNRKLHKDGSDTSGKAESIESDNQDRLEPCPGTVADDGDDDEEETCLQRESARRKKVGSHDISLRSRTSLGRSAECASKQLNLHTEEKPFKCNVCGAEFKNRDRLVGHERKHKGENPFQCKICGARFDRTCRLRAHASKHTGVKPFHCEICGSGFTLNSTLQIHMRKHTGETPYICDDCGAKFANRRKLKIHRITHTGEKPYKCDICGAGFNQTYNLQIHKRKHTGEKPYKCDICGMGFADNSNLKVHKRRHAGHDPYRCDVCGVGFSHNVGLQIHKSKHRVDKPHKCDTCGLRFSVKSSLQNHKGKHTGEKPYRCDICGVRFYAKTSLLNHKRKHMGEKPYKCDICGIRFYVHMSLLNHRMKHTGEKPYECEFCCIKFSVNSSLQNHRRKHTGEKPYLCDMCGTEFAHSGSLRDHKRLHTGEKPYKCGLCGAVFSNRKKLQRHRKVHSGDNLYTCSIPGFAFSQSEILQPDIWTS